MVTSRLSNVLPRRLRLVHWLPSFFDPPMCPAEYFWIQLKLPLLASLSVIFSSNTSKQVIWLSVVYMVNNKLRHLTVGGKVWGIAFHNCTYWSMITATVCTILSFTSATWSGSTCRSVYSLSLLGLLGMMGPTTTYNNFISKSLLQNRIKTQPSRSKGYSWSMKQNTILGVAGQLK